ncbi:phenylalanine--tRNA ligase subunit alpha [Candidatus Woesearchaeota archaeon]|nr:phenylalanine--tRNA ligase subunit alpha [Candidatus Woesearchaeota archaeon]
MTTEKTAEIAASLHRLERAVLPHISKLSSVEDVVVAARMQEVEVLRALQWLQNKGLAKLTEKIEEIIRLGENGKNYAKSLLPEARFLNSIANKPQALAEIKKAANLSDEEMGASIGALMRIKAIEPVAAAAEKTFKITESGRQIAKSGLRAQRFLSGQNFPVGINNLSGEEKNIVTELKKRKDVIKEDVVKKRTAFLTELGKEVLKKAASAAETVDRLTPEMLITGRWKEAAFRSYDLTAPVPRVFFGKLQPYREFLEEVREKFVSMGFEEMTGPIVESEFWNMDALFMPQFHSARDIHDVYYVKEPKYATDLPRQLVKKVKAAHENGFGTGSKGWRYEFSEEKTARLIMRSQTTACSSRKLASTDLKIPGKYFAIGRCFRYDVIDTKHLADFNQVEGIVVEENLSLRHLIGLLKLFAKEFCNTDKVKVVPSYFPFTEPSASLYAKHPELGWMELGGAGIFRPEMVKPLVGSHMQIGRSPIQHRQQPMRIDPRSIAHSASSGIVPVIAWGIGIDRVAMFKLGLNDIRELFSHDLNFLRNAKVV